MLPRPLLFIALDYRGKDANNEIYRTVERLSSIDGPFGYKLNLDAIERYDPTGDLLRKVADLGRPVFVDMKMGNGSGTMASVTQDLCNRGAKIVNAWAHLGPLLTRAAEVAEEHNSALFAVTVLTHFGDEEYRKLYGHRIDDGIVRYTKMAEEYGCHGVILPGTKLHLVSDSPLYKLVPGIRPEWYREKDTNQEQQITPRDAAVGGADYLVCGRPILSSIDPVKALGSVLEEMSV